MSNKQPSAQTGKGFMLPKVVNYKKHLSNRNPNSSIYDIEEESSPVRSISGVNNMQFGQDDRSNNNNIERLNTIS